MSRQSDRRAADEARVRERVLAYLRDRKAFEEGTAEYARRLDADQPIDDLPDLGPRLDAFQRVYRREHSIERSGAVLTLTSRPLVDPDRIRIVKVTIRGDQASLRSVEERLDGSTDPLPTDEYTYRLERVEGDWWIVDRFVWIDGARIRAGL